ncbi:MAG TPA: hypothetical protein VJU86_12920 [Pyrinomonadaceae bacterium]|nr:hypothetical protein [Pyrinomonadaceae bacterium]
MTRTITPDRLLANRNGEQGAALLTMLLVAILLLSAGLALVTATSLSTTNTIDSTAEMQAYSGAEAGLEATLNVLRGNVAPDASLGAIKINFRNAANPLTSNKTSDPWATGAGAASRLSGWLNYTYQNGTDWRVPITDSYAPNTGIAFKILITDPDDPGVITARQIRNNADYRPTQLIIQSVGYGPKGAVKRLEMILKFSAFDFEPPASITLPGGPGLALDMGDSDPVKYLGTDLAGLAAEIPAIAVDAGNVVDAQAVIDGMHSATQVTPHNAGALDASNTPSFIQSADAGRDFLAEMRELADTSGRLFGTKDEADDSDGGMGTSASPKLTFIDNYGGAAVELGSNHQGSGLLIVTGELLTHGNTDFEGVILVLGRGKLDRDGGGNGTLKGAILVANFDPDDPNDEVIGPPEFSINGAGTSKISFDSLWVRKALDVSGFRVLGVREYHEDGYLGG